MSVDRKRVFNALQLQRQNVCVNFAWGVQLCFPMPSLSIKSFFVDELGVDVLVPVSYRDLEILKRISTHATKTKGLDIMDLSSGCSLHINETKIKSTSGSFVHTAVPHLITLITQNLFGFKIKMPSKVLNIHLCKLMVVECGQHTKFHSESEKKSGTFAIIVLTIPVEGGFSGGKINVKCDSQKHSFQFEQGSDHQFSLVAFLENCYNEVEPISEGWMLAMVFHLVWPEAVETGLSPFEFPVFIKAFNEISEELMPWSSIPAFPVKGCTWPATKREVGHANDTSGGFVSENKLENPDTPATPEKSDVHDSEDINNAKTAKNQIDEDRVRCATRILTKDSEYEEHVLFFPLQGKYDNTKLSLTQLEGRDRLIAHIFQSIGFLDVQLTVISQLNEGKLDHHVDWERNIDWNERIFQVFKWIESKDNWPLSQQLRLDGLTQLVGNIERIAWSEDGSNVEAKNTMIYYHNALIIQPRSQSIRRACRYQLDDVINYMEQKIRTLETTTDLISCVQQELVWTLKQVIAFSVAEPRLVWTDPCPAANQRSWRLLELSIKLKAKQEGLDLLESMATYVVNPTKTISPTTGIPNVFVEGIRGTRVAKAVADFESRISDWNTCGHLIMKFITPLHVFRRLTCFCSLAWHLFENDSIEGAQMVADRISFILTKLLSSEQTNVLDDHQISSFLYLIVTMETNVSTTSPERIEAVVTLFGRLDVYRQCLLIIDLQANYYDVINNVPSCRSLFRQLCEFVASSDLHSSSSLLDLSIPLIKVYVSFNDSELLQMLIEKLCLVDDSKDIHTNYLLDSILLSPDIREISTFSTLGQSAISELLNARIDQLLETGFLPESSSGTEMHASADPEEYEKVLRHNAAFQANLASYIHLVLSMETIQDLGHFDRVLLLGLMVFSLTFERLCDLILDVRRLGEAEVKSHPSKKELYVELCRMLSHFDGQCAKNVSSKKIIEVLKCFVWLQDRELVQSLVHQICLGGSRNYSYLEDENVFVDIIFCAPHLLDRLIPDVFNFTTITVDALFKAWINDICNSLVSGDLAFDQNLPSSDSVLREPFHVNVAKCFQLYIRNEKRYPHPSQYSLNLFSPLLAKLSTWRMAHILIQIHRSDIGEESSLKESGTCVHLIRHIGQQFATRDMTALIKSERVEILDCLVEVMVCLLWLGDHCSLLPYSHQICFSFQRWQENPLVYKMVSSTKVRKMALTCHNSRMALCRLVEQRINRLKMIKAKEPALHSSNTSCLQPASNKYFYSSQSQLDEMKFLQRLLQSKPELHIQAEDHEGTQ
ncbi:hypothetical protein GHT06_022784 [Daphnia sinensis]|uniref:Uncharacterized protein n=1 Tax=Daphnia sinensis TaxID=1820382 RepID=A0AAD5PNZ9_9CRUS|nr:hypothetical protein GHT06_022784 [Daphnia sinensis]